MIQRYNLILVAKILGAILLVPLVLLSLAELYFYVTYVPPNIVDFRPSNFEAKADAPFLYSIGNKLKYSDELDPRAPTLVSGRIEDFVVSPDNSKIAVVANKALTVVSAHESKIQKVVSVDSIYASEARGRQFFRDEDFQWSRDSKYPYLIKDEYYNSKGSQLFSNKGELWRYSLETGNLELILRHFPAYNYFFGLNSGIYFSVPTESGDLQLKYFDGQSSTTNVGSPNAEIPVAKLASNFTESPFFSFLSANMKRR